MARPDWSANNPVMDSDATQTVTLPGVRTRNGMRISNLIAMLSLVRIQSGETIWRLGENDLAVATRIDFEILSLVSSDLDRGVRDRVYLMPLDCAEQRCKEQHKNLKIVSEQTYRVFAPGQ